MDILHILQEPWAIRALIATTMVGITCGMLGAFIVLRNMSLVGDALSHARQCRQRASTRHRIDVFVGFQHRFGSLLKSRYAKAVRTGNGEQRRYIPKDLSDVMVGHNIGAHER